MAYLKSEKVKWEICNVNCVQMDYFAFPLFICEIEEKLYAENFDH